MTRQTIFIAAAALLAAPFAAPAPALAQATTTATTSFTTADGTPVTVTDHPGNSISPNYSIDFATMDANDDDRIVRAEASGNADLLREFHVVDRNDDGRLTREEMKGWLN